MKKLFFVMILTTVIVTTAKAQHVKVRINFPAGVVINAPGPPPFAGGIWIGPEWRWQGRTYVYVPGYWARPHKKYRYWAPGHWKGTRWGYRWVPGHWH